MLPSSRRKSLEVFPLLSCCFAYFCRERERERRKREREETGVEGGRNLGPTVCAGRFMIKRVKRTVRQSAVSHPVSTSLSTELQLSPCVLHVSSHYPGKNKSPLTYPGSYSVTYLRKSVRVLSFCRSQILIDVRFTRAATLALVIFFPSLLRERLFFFF